MNIELEFPDELLRDLPPDQKVKMISAMGFTPVRDVHQPDCMAALDSGIRCICVPDPTVWMQPEDVIRHRHETWEERLAEKRARRDH